MTSYSEAPSSKECLPKQSVELIRDTLEDMRKHGLTSGLPQEHAFTLLEEIKRLRTELWVVASAIWENVNREEMRHWAQGIRVSIRGDEPPAFTVETRDDAERELLQVVQERDGAEAYADQLSDMVGILLEQDFGEHSSANDPWENAIEAMRVAIYEKQNPAPAAADLATQGTGQSAPGGTIQPSDSALKASVDGWQCKSCNHENPKNALSCQNRKCRHFLGVASQENGSLPQEKT